MDSDDVAILLLCLHWLHIFPKSQKLKDLAILVVVLVPERERERERESSCQYTIGLHSEAEKEAGVVVPAS